MLTTERRYWDRREAMTLAELRTDQFARLKPILDRAYERAPYYRVSFDAAGVRPTDIDSLDALACLPFITKSGIIEAQQANPPYGGFLTVEPADLARIYVAPGPMYWPLTAEDFDGSCEASAIAMWSAGVRASDIADVTTNYHWVAGGTSHDAAFRKVGCAVVPGGIGNTKMHLESMRALGVTTTHAFSTYFVTLAETAKEMGIDLRKDLSLRVVVIGGELAPKKTLMEIEQQYGIKTFEVYGGNEGGLVSYDCEAHTGMHLGPHQIVEILDPVTHEPVPEGHGGEIVITALWRSGVPIIRYRSGDLVAYVSHEPCSCGRKTPRLGPIVGRVGDIPRVKGMFIVPRQIENALYSFNGLGRFQMIVERPEHSDVLTVRIEADGGVNRTGTKEAVVKALREAIRIGAEVEFVDAGTLPKDASIVVDRREA